jgi:hypothetical protein
MAVPVGHRIVVLKLAKNIKNVIAFAQNVASSMDNNPAFPSPNPPIATLLADVAALSAAESAILSRTKGTVETRNARLAAVRSDLYSLRAYVQSIGSRETAVNASALIESAGMTSRNPRPYGKPVLAAKQRPIHGTVLLMAKMVGRTAAYTWQYSTDQITWTSVRQTIQAKTTVSGLEVATTYWFRVQALTRQGEQTVSQTVSLLVT